MLPVKAAGCDPCELEGVDPASAARVDALVEVADEPLSAKGTDPASPDDRPAEIEGGVTVEIGRVEAVALVVVADAVAVFRFVPLVALFVRGELAVLAGVLLCVRDGFLPLVFNAAVEVGLDAEAWFAWVLADLPDVVLFCVVGGFPGCGAVLVCVCRLDDLGARYAGICCGKNICSGKYIGICWWKFGI
jgi:hypothetical protein